MRIAALTIKNFRSFGPTPQVLKFDNRLNCFIGLNSAGKTAAMAAFQKLFGSRNERTLFREDFHIAHDEDSATDEEKSLSIEVEIKFGRNDNSVPDLFKDMVVSAPGKPPYVRILLEASWTPSASSMEGEVEINQYFITVPTGVAITDQSKRGFPKAMYGLIQVIYVPALRKTSEQLRYASGSILHRLLKTVEYTQKFKDEFKAETEKINGMFQAIPSFKAIQDSLHTVWSSFHKDQRYKDATMNLGKGEVEEILRKLEINFTPGTGAHRSFAVDDLGDGYRSMFYLSLVCTLLEIEDSLPADMEIEGSIRPYLTILTVEEPENHIAPQLLGRVIKILEQISKKANTQVFFSTHTPAIIKRVDPEIIHHFQITDEETTEVNQVTLPDKEAEAYKYVKEAVQNFPEIYFAKLVVIGEGDTEEVVFNHLMRVLDTDFDDNIISFAPLGHRFVNHIWRLLTDLNIPFITLLDLDLEREGGGWGRIKYAVKELIAIGCDKKKLLEIKDGVLSDKELNDMHTWGQGDQKNQKAWIDCLKEHGVYFSAPLDLDFMLLEAFEAYYTSDESFPKGGGPQIPEEKEEYEEDEEDEENGEDDEENKKNKYEKYLASAIAATLKSKEATGSLYNEKQHRLMIWYKYHFLGRGKPGTHMQVLPTIPEKELKANLPAVLKEVFDEIKDSIA